ncbi:T9SS type A sorting domain-containing protein [Pontibacter sp. 13R65]|uniref:T9SS type A sorting domain-containing protein n=1 Tax=Pontibacter sp. 13R65 TaxID=3127458 RepID=UPI00301DEA0A
MKQLLSLLLLCFSCLWLTPTQASHLRGGYITYTTDAQNPRSYNFEMVVFRDITGVGAEPSVTIFTGLDNVIVTKTSEIDLGDNISRLTYVWNSTYPADGTYTVSWVGINRNNNILNVAQPSEQHSFLLQTTFTVSSLNPDRHGINYLNPSTTDAYAGTPLKFNLQAYDADGDSLVYSLTSPYRMSANNTPQPVPGYTIPEGLSVNQFGEINWPEPTTKGEFIFAVEVKAYRDKRLVHTSINDLQVLVRDAEAAPEFSLTNQNQLNISSGGYILAKPDIPLKLSFFVKNPSDKTLEVLQPVSELQEPHLNTQNTIQIAHRDSAGGIVKEILFTPTTSLKRSVPFALGIRGQVKTQDNGRNLYKREFVYLLVGDQLSNSLPDLLPELAHLLYPNPAGTHFIVEAPAASSAIFRLYALDGRLVKEQVLQPGKNRVVRPSGINTGLYTYQISSHGYRSRTGKLLLE